MSTNMNPVTGIRYGLIAAQSLDPEIVDEMQSRGTDVHWDAHAAEVRALCEQSVQDGELSADDLEQTIEHKLEYDRWYDDEPIHSFDIDGVRGQTTWLGGALLVWIFESPFTGLFRLCSPCVPGACNLDSPADPLRDNVGQIGYDVPNNWRNENE